MKAARGYEDLDFFALYISEDFLLNGILHFGFTMLLKQWAKEKKKRRHF